MTRGDAETVTGAGRAHSAEAASNLIASKFASIHSEHAKTVTSLGRARLWREAGRCLSVPR